MITSQLNDRRRHRHHPARVNHGGLDTLGGKHLGGFQSHASHSAHGNEQHVTLTGFRVGFTGACQHIHAVAAALQGGNVLSHGALRVANHGRCIVNSYSLTQLFAQGRAITRSRQVQTRNELQHRQIPHAVVACTVRAGNAGAVQHHGHARLVQGNVHEQLVKAAVQEGCVEGNHRVHAAVRQAGTHRHGVLLSNTYVNNALGVALLEFAQTHGNEHRTGDTDDVLLLIRNICDFATKDTGPRLGGAGRNILTGQRVNLAHRVELIVLIRAGGRVAVALLGNGVHNHRAGVVLRRSQCVLHSLLVVAVNRAHVLHAQVFKNALGYDDVLNARLHAVQAAVHHLTNGAATLQTDAHRIQCVVVAVIEAHAIHLLLHAVLELRELVRETANGRRVGAAVIVDHNHDLAGAVGSNIVHSLPRHAAGQRAVTNENHGVAVIFTVELVRARNTVSPRNRARGVRRRNDVVLRLAAIRVAGQAALLTQSLKRVTTSHQLMHIGLVAGVEKNVVLGRLKNTVNAEGQLHNTQVRAQVTAGRRHVRHDELADFLRELLQLLVAEVLQVRRGLNTREQLGSGTIANAVVGGGCATGGAIRGLLLRQCVFSGHTPTLLKVGARLIPCVGSSMILPFKVPKSRFMRPQSKTHRVERKRPEITPSGQAGEQPNPPNTAIICCFVTATSCALLGAAAARTRLRRGTLKKRHRLHVMRIRVHIKRPKLHHVPTQLTQNTGVTAQGCRVARHVQNTLGVQRIQAFQGGSVRALTGRVKDHRINSGDFTKLKGGLQIHQVACHVAANHLNAGVRRVLGAGATIRREVRARILVGHRGALNADDGTGCAHGVRERGGKQARAGVQVEGAFTFLRTEHGEHGSDHGGGGGAVNLPEAAGRYLVAESAGAEGDFFGDGAQTRAEQLVAFGYAAVGGVGGAGAAALGLAVGGGLRGEEQRDLALGEQSPGVGCLLFDVLGDLFDGEARINDELQ